MIPPTATKEESTALLDQIREIVLDDPVRLYMKEWHDYDWDPTLIPNKPGGCGSTHCLAGWAQALSNDPDVRCDYAMLVGDALIPTANHMFFASESRVLQFLLDREYAK